jgi:hypothetical protein
MPLRRQVLVLAAAPLAGAGCSTGTAMRFETITQALQALQGLPADARSRGAWTLPQVFNHLAQSIEYSMQGFPEPRSALFQATVGKAAFAVFRARGRMSHGLAEPIPGAPALSAGDVLPAALARLQRSLRDFDAHGGALQPHFAYGALDKADYTRAHLMHLADHWSEFDLPRNPA